MNYILDEIDHQYIDQVGQVGIISQAFLSETELSKMLDIKFSTLSLKHTRYSEHFFYEEHPQAQQIRLLNLTFSAVPLIDLLNKYKKSNVLILSGDVHFAQLYSSKCKGLMGGYKLWEFTSSGLSHHLADFNFKPKQEVELYTNDFWIENEMVIDFNFGLIEIEQSEGNGFKVLVKALGQQGETHFSQSIKSSEMQFTDPKLQKGSQLCETVHYKHIYALSYHAMLKETIEMRNIFSLINLLVIPGIKFGLAFSILIKLVRKVLCFNKKDKHVTKK